METYNYPSSINHYTSMNVLYSIIKYGEIWLGSTSFMNDREEIMHFIRQLEDALTRELPDNKADSCKEFFNRVMSAISYPYIMCFSRLDDDAAQWERYADNARGVCIAFNTRKIMELFCGPGFVFGNIYYDYNIEEHDHYKLLYNYFTAGEMTGFNAEDDQVENMIACGYIHKHYSFRSEREIRLSTLWDNVPEGAKVESECINGVIKSFLKIDLKKKCQELDIDFADLFDMITIGPRSQMTPESLKRYFDEQKVNIPIEKIVKSDCPLR